jgi:glycosyltransferase involved in cell wall biosynthesis
MKIQALVAAVIPDAPGSAIDPNELQDLIDASDWDGVNARSAESRAVSSRDGAAGAPQARRTTLLDRLYSVARDSEEDFDPVAATKAAAALCLSQHNHVLSPLDQSEAGQAAIGGVFVEDGMLHLWGINQLDPSQPVDLGLVVDGRRIFDARTDPTTGRVAFAATRLHGRHRSLGFELDGTVIPGPAFTALSFWKDPDALNELADHLADMVNRTGYLGARYTAKCHLPKTMARLDAAGDDKVKGRIPEFVRYMANRYDCDTKNLVGYQGTAQWIISDVMEYADRRSIFCMTNEIHEALSEGVFNKRALKNDVSLALFSFWRRHYQHIDIFSDEGLRKVQYKFATAPFISDKNNQLLISKALKERLSAVVDAYRSRALPWSWYWLFRHEDEGTTHKMMEAGYAVTLSFKEVLADLIEQNRCSFNPRNWMSYWGSTPQEVAGHFTRFDLALISLLNGRAVPEELIAERGPEVLRRQLIDQVYSRSPRLAAISAVAQDLASAPEAEPAIERIDLVVIGHANATGLGRNLNMFVEALSGFDPLVFNADDGQCVNPEGRYREDMNLRARVVVLCVNADRAPEMIARFASICEDAHIIGFYLWETDTPPETHLLGANAVDEIWAPSDFVADGYRKITSTPISNIRKGLAHPPARVFSPFLDRFRRSPSELIFLSLAEFGSSIVRKNPLSVVKAFQQAFAEGDEEVRLLLKMREIDPGHWSNFDGYWEEVEERITGDSRIEIVEGNLTDAEYWSLIDSSDVFVALHRAEGFGYGIADAMMLGKPVIVSDYSGTTDFCEADNAFLIDVDVVPTPPEQMRSKSYVGHWASPRVDQAAAAMRAILTDREAAKARALKGQARIFADYSFDDWRSGLSTRIRDQLARQG